MDEKARRRARYRGTNAQQEGATAAPPVNGSSSTPLLQPHAAPAEPRLYEVVKNVGQPVYREPVASQRLRLYARRDLFASHARRVKALNKQRINLSALSTGPAIRMLNDAITYAKERRQFDQVIGEFQLVQAMLAECKVEIEAARALILETARKRDRNEDVTMDVSLCKYFSTEMCGRVADKVVQVFGGAGYIKGTGIERFYRDVRAFRIYEGTSQIHLLNIARNLLK